MKSKIILIALLLICAMQLDARTYLVAVGINDYSSFSATVNDLRLPVNDAKVIADLYSKNTSVDYALLLDDKATKDRIIRAMRKVFNKAEKNDIVVFFFSGHGYLGGLCANDDKLEYDEIKKVMSESKSLNKMIFVDACKSGGMRVEDSHSPKSTDTPENKNVLLFLASRAGEYSIEHKKMENGFFTAYLQKGLKGAADTNRDRIITARELYDYVHNGVVKISHDQQHPVMWGNFNDDMPVMVWQ